MKEKILVVDDDRAIRDLLTAVLSREFQVSEAESGAALQKSFLEPQPDVIVPRQHACSFEDSLTADSAGDLARLLVEAYGAIHRAFDDPGYEMALHTAPNLRSRILQGDWATIRDDYHWHIEIVAQPERVNRLGGIFINETAPESVAAGLRAAWDKR